MVTRREMAVRIFAQGWLDGTADLRGMGAAWMKAAGGRRRDRVRRLALDDRSLARAVLLRVRDRDRGQERLRVGVDRLDIQLLPGRYLNQLAEVHDRDAVGYVAHDREVVSDEHVAETEAVLEVVEQVDDLRLDRNIQRRDRLVEKD